MWIVKTLYNKDFAIEGNPSYFDDYFNDPLSQNNLLFIVINAVDQWSML